MAWTITTGPEYTMGRAIADWGRRHAEAERLDRLLHPSGPFLDVGGAVQGGIEGFASGMRSGGGPWAAIGLALGGAADEGYERGRGADLERAEQARQQLLSGGRLGGQRSSVTPESTVFTPALESWREEEQWNRERDRALDDTYNVHDYRTFGMTTQDIQTAADQQGLSVGDWKSQRLQKLRQQQQQAHTEAAVKHQRALQQAKDWDEKFNTWGRHQDVDDEINALKGLSAKVRSSSAIRGMPLTPTQRQQAIGDIQARIEAAEGEIIRRRKRPEEMAAEAMPRNWDELVAKGGAIQMRDKDGNPTNNYLVPQGPNKGMRAYDATSGEDRESGLPPPGSPPAAYREQTIEGRLKLQKIATDLYGESAAQQGLTPQDILEREHERLAMDRGWKRPEGQLPAGSPPAAQDAQRTMAEASRTVKGFFASGGSKRHAPPQIADAARVLVRGYILNEGRIPEEHMPLIRECADLLVTDMRKRLKGEKVDVAEEEYLRLLLRLVDGK